jgi:hypothetical protein
MGNLYFSRDYDDDDAVDFKVCPFFISNRSIIEHTHLIIEWASKLKE